MKTITKKLAVGLAVATLAGACAAPESTTSEQVQPLSDAERVYCTRQLGDVLQAAASLAIPHVAESTVWYPSDIWLGVDPETLKGDVKRAYRRAIRRANDSFSKWMRLDARQADLGRWPSYGIESGLGEAGSPPKHFKWYEAKDYPRACRAAYESR